jgi:hypothetical protein
MPAKPRKTASAAKTKPKRGTAGTRGPVPKRSTERRRRNKETQVETVTLTGAGPVEVPPADEAWHPIAKDWYLSLAKSGQSKYYEPSDWQAARYVAEVMTKNLKAKRFSAQLMASVWAAMTDLLTTEADRRRVRMEIERPDGEDTKQPAGVTAIGEYRDRLKKKPATGAGGG